MFSTSACSILSENESLELGNYATWKPEDIIGRGVVRDLFSVTEDVITRIDGVGYYNKSGSGTKTTDRTSDRTQEVPPAMLRASTAYW